MRVEAIVPPADKLTCKPEPRVPDVINDATNAAFVIAALNAGADCRAKLGWVRDWAAGVRGGK